MAAASARPPFEDFGSWFVEGEGYKDVLRYASIPIVAALIGYGTNVLAIQMTFLPLEYLGFGEAFFHKWGFSLGWQGIIPSKAEKMARKACFLITTKLMNLRDVFEKVEAARIVAELEPVLHRSMERVVTEVALTHAPSVWISLSFETREELVRKVCEVAPKYIAAMIDEMKENIEDVLDLEDCLVEKLTEDKRLINEVFKRCGESEFRFIERSGLYFGLLLGFIQAAIWFFVNEVLKGCALRHVEGIGEDGESVRECGLYPGLPTWWFLPLAGALCGYATNLIAMWLIFKPIEPTTYLGCLTLHGLFLKRQDQVSEEFATISAARLLTAQNCWERILFGPRSYHLERIVTRQVKRAIDEQVGLFRALLPIVVGAETFLAAKEQSVALVFGELPRMVPFTYAYTTEAMNAEQQLRERLQSLPSAEFEGVLHPVFEEDEWKLIGVGGLLGMWVGIFQALFVFGDSAAQ